MNSKIIARGDHSRRAAHQVACAQFWIRHRVRSDSVRASQSNRLPKAISCTRQRYKQPGT